MLTYQDGSFTAKNSSATHQEGFNGLRIREGLALALNALQQGSFTAKINSATHQEGFYGLRIWEGLALALNILQHGPEPKHKTAVKVLTVKAVAILQ